METQAEIHARNKECLRTTKTKKQRTFWPKSKIHSDWSLIKWWRRRYESECLLVIGVIFPKAFCEWIADDLQLCHLKRKKYIFYSTTKEHKQQIFDCHNRNDESYSVEKCENHLNFCGSSIRMNVCVFNFFPLIASTIWR